MSQTLVRKVVPFQVREVPQEVWYLNNLKRPLLYEGKIIDWRYCDRVACSNAGVSGCHGCSNWQENQNGLKVEQGMTILFCTRLACGRRFEVIGGRWEYGSYCSLYCGQNDVLARSLSEAGPDEETPDELLGINAFRNKPMQMGTGDEKEPLQPLG